MELKLQSPPVESSLFHKVYHLCRIDGAEDGADIYGTTIDKIVACYDFFRFL